MKGLMSLLLLLLLFKDYFQIINKGQFLQVFVQIQKQDCWGKNDCFRRTVTKPWCLEMFLLCICLLNTVFSSVVV